MENGLRIAEETGADRDRQHLRRMD